MFLIVLTFTLSVYIVIISSDEIPQSTGIYDQIVVN